MKRWLPVAAALGVVWMSWDDAVAAEGAKRKILFFSKSSGFEHEVIKRQGEKPAFAEQVLAEIARTNDFQFTFSKDGSLFSPEYLKQFDAFFFYTTGDLATRGTDKQPPMTPSGKQALLGAIEQGKGFIGTHSATDTFHSPGNADKNSPQRYKSDAALDPYIAMVGAEFIRHGAQQKSHLIVADPKFPGLEAVPQDFAPLEEWYSLKNFATNLHVLLIQDTSKMVGNMYQRAAYPCTWVRSYGKGRVFYTNMGHREDVWTNSIFQSVLIGGINWALGRSDGMPIESNMTQVTPNASELPPPR